MRLTATILVAAAAIVVCKQASADTSLRATNDDVLPQSVGEFDTSKNDNDDERMFNFLTRIWEHLKSIFHFKSTSINPKPETNIHSETIPASVSNQDDTNAVSHTSESTTTNSKPETNIHSETIPASVSKQDDTNAVSHTSKNVDSKFTESDVVVVNEKLQVHNAALAHLKRLWNQEKNKGVDLAQFMLKHELQIGRVFVEGNMKKKNTDKDFVTINMILKALVGKNALKKFADAVDSSSNKDVKDMGDRVLDSLLTTWKAKGVELIKIDTKYGPYLADKYYQEKIEVGRKEARQKEIESIKSMLYD